MNLSREEAEETSFSPRALSVPRRAVFRCDIRCSDKALDDVKESYTVNLCQQCFHERLTAQGLAPLKSWRQVPKTTGKSAIKEPSPSRTARWVSRKRIKVAILKLRQRQTGRTPIP